MFPTEISYQKSRTSLWESSIDLLSRQLLLGYREKWPERHVSNDGVPVPFHLGQQLAYDSTRRIVAMLAGTQGGKALALDTILPSPGGPILMGNIKAGDTIFDEKKKPCKVAYVTGVMLHHRCYKLEFGNSFIVADEDHLWPGKISTKQIASDPQRYIDSCFITRISDTASVPVRCIQVDNPSHLYLAGNDIPTHNTSFGPWWLLKEIELRGGGDYLAVTANYDLFKLKMLPAMLEVFEQIMGRARFWAGDKIFEISDPDGKFTARRSTDSMYARIILRSANAVGGLESSTAKAAWFDEFGLDDFSFEAYKAGRRRLSIHKGRMLLTSTLYNMGWAKREIIDKAKKDIQPTVQYIGNAEIETYENISANRLLIQYDSTLNPVFPEEEYQEAKATLSDSDFSMKYRGRDAVPETMIYNCIDKLNYCPRFKIPDHWQRYIGVDFGGVHTAAIYLAEEPQSKTLYLYREYLEGNKLSTEHARDLLRGEPMIPMGAGGSRSEGQWRMEFAAGGLPLAKLDFSDVRTGISYVYSQFKNHKLIIFDDMGMISDEISKYKRKRGKEDETLEEIENKNLFHLADALRYIIAMIRPIQTGWSQGAAR